MDESVTFAYIGVVRLLLLLSALLSALSGVTGGRAQAQPALAASVGAAPRASAGLIAARPARASFLASAPVRFSLAGSTASPRPAFVLVARPAYAERRRE